MVSGDFCKHEWPGSGCPECKDEADAPMLEQIAQRFATYAGDQRASIRKGWVKGASARGTDIRACTYEDAAKEIRDLVTAQNKAEYQVAINKVLDDFGTSQVLRDDVSLAIVEIFFGKVKTDG